MVGPKQNGIYVKAEEHDIFKVSVDNFQDTSFCQKAIILGEGPDDSLFYSKILGWYKMQNRINISFLYRFQNGGGSGISNSIKSGLKNGDIFVAIIDSDKKYPGDTNLRGKTYSKCKQYVNHEKGRFKLIVLKTQEVENLIPFNFIDTLKFDGELKNHKFFLDKIKVNDEELLQYYDMKEGIPKEKIKTDENYYKYAKDCCNSAGISDFDSHYDRIDDKQTVCPGLGPSLLAKVLEKIDDSNICNSELMTFQEVEWENIGSVLKDFTCAINTEAINSLM